MSGGNQALGIAASSGVILAVNNANAKGMLPFTLATTTLDDQCSGTASPAQAQSAVANATLVAVVGPECSGATKAAEPYYSAAHLATLSPSATAAALAKGTNNNFMRDVPGDDVQGAADAKFIVKTKKLTNVEVINDGSFYGAGLATVFQKTAKSLKARLSVVTIPGTAQCADGTGSPSEYASAATQIKAKNPKAVFYGGYYCDFALLLGALHSVGYKGVVMSGDGSNDPALIKSTSPHSAANGVYLSIAGGGSAYLTGTLATQYQALPGAPAAATAPYAAQAYDAANMIIAALQKVVAAHPSDTVMQLRPLLVTELHALTFHGVTGVIKFQANGDLSRSSVVDFSQVVKGKIKTIGHS